MLTICVADSGDRRAEKGLGGLVPGGSKSDDIFESALFDFLDFLGFVDFFEFVDFLSSLDIGSADVSGEKRYWKPKIVDDICGEVEYVLDISSRCLGLIIFIYIYLRHLILCHCGTANDRRVDL